MSQEYIESKVQFLEMRVATLQGIVDRLKEKHPQIFEELKTQDNE